MDINDRQLDERMRQAFREAFPDVSPPEPLTNAAVHLGQAAERGREAEKLLGEGSAGPEANRLLATATIGRLALMGMVPDMDYELATRQLSESPEFRDLTEGTTPQVNLSKLQSGELLRGLGSNLKKYGRAPDAAEAVARTGPDVSGPVAKPPEIEAPKMEPPQITNPGAIPPGL